MGELIFLIICCLIVFTNIINSIFTFKLRYGKNYLLHLIVPTILFPIVYIAGIYILKFFENSYEIYCDILMIVLVLIFIIFSVFQSLLISVKYMLDRDNTYIPLVLIYLITSVLVPAVNIICTYFAFIIFLVVKTLNKKKPIRYIMYN